MITRITGVLSRVLEDRVRLTAGPLEYEALVSELVRRRLERKVGEELSLFTSHYLEGNAMQGRMSPRLVGFLSEAELEFFELFCTVDKVGVKKALRALNRPIRDIADAIQRQDAKWLTTLPGIGPASAEQVIATLRRKVAKFALMHGDEDAAATAPAAPSHVEQDAQEALVAVGLSHAEARGMIEKLRGQGPFASVEELLQAAWTRRNEKG
jgi:Holliday junction DNA helicase RuvA